MGLNHNTPRSIIFEAMEVAWAMVTPKPCKVKPISSTAPGYASLFRHGFPQDLNTQLGIISTTPSPSPSTAAGTQQHLSDKFQGNFL